MAQSRKVDPLDAGLRPGAVEEHDDSLPNQWVQPHHGVAAAKLGEDRLRRFRPLFLQLEQSADQRGGRFRCGGGELLSPPC